MTKGTRPPPDKGPFSSADRDRCGYIGNEFVVACRHCDKIHRHPAAMRRESLEAIKDHFERFANCTGCGVVLKDVEWRKLSPRNSELRAMEQASRWMTNDKGGIPPTAQDLWSWLERSPPIPYDDKIDDRL